MPASVIVGCWHGILCRPNRPVHSLPSTRQAALIIASVSWWLACGSLKRIRVSRRIAGGPGPDAGCSAELTASTPHQKESNAREHARDDAHRQMHPVPAQEPMSPTNTNSVGSGQVPDRRLGLEGGGFRRAGRRDSRTRQRGRRLPNCTASQKTWSCVISGRSLARRHLRGGGLPCGGSAASGRSLALRAARYRPHAAARQHQVLQSGLYGSHVGCRPPARGGAAPSPSVTPPHSSGPSAVPPHPQDGGRRRRMHARPQVETCLLMPAPTSLGYRMRWVGAVRAAQSAMPVPPSTRPKIHHPVPRTVRAGCDRLAGASGTGRGHARAVIEHIRG